jgi:hypothetical protein
MSGDISGGLVGGAGGGRGGYGPGSVSILSGVGGDGGDDLIGLEDLGMVQDGTKCGDVKVGAGK